MSYQNENNKNFYRNSKGSPQKKKKKKRNSKGKLVKYSFFNKIYL